MRREPPITFPGALQILGHYDRQWLDRLDKLLGGVVVDLTIVCWSAAMEEATLRWLRDPLLSKDDLVTWMTNQLVAMLTVTMSSPG